jgi:NAD(P)H-dependent FMN reductase
MKRLLLNGSPRGKASNSRRILSWIAEGMAAAGAVEDIPVLDLASVKAVASQAEAFAGAQEIVLAFPLYTDSMPGIVKNFLETAARLGPDAHRGKRAAFIVQSGFSESIHSEAVAAYLARLCRRLGMVHAGTLIKGNGEGIRLMPDSANAKLKARFVRAGTELVSDGRFSEGLAGELAKPRILGAWGRFVMRLGVLTGMTNIYWNMMLKKNGAYERRFDAPYGPRASAP